MKKRTGDDWFPFWIDKWLLGSTRDELTIEQCAVWVDFLALSYKDDGYIRANEGIPYPIKRLAGLLNRPEKLIQQTIDRCLEPKINKLKLESDGTLYVISHPDYELSKRHKRRLKEEKPKEEEIYNKIFIQCPPEFSTMANKSGTVRVGRLVAAIILGRSLKPEEEIHHRDKKESNNRPENLMLFKNHADHTRYEHGIEVMPIWDGSRMTDKTAIMAIRTATKRREEENREEENREEDPPHLRIKFNFKKKDWQGISKSDRKQWNKTFPDLDIGYWLKRMTTWILLNPRKGRKKNYARFINNWLSDEQDKINIKKSGKLKDEARRKKWLKKKD